MKVEYEAPEAVPNPKDFDSPMDFAMAEQRYLDDCREFLAHEGYNVYAAQGIRLPYPWPTWWIFGEDAVRNLYAGGGLLLKTMLETLRVKPAVIQSDSGPKECIFACRYELISYKARFTGAGFQYPKALIDSGDNETLGWVDFVAGLPYGVMEQMVAVWEIAVIKFLKLWKSMEGGEVTPPFPNQLFQDYAEETKIFSLLWLDSEKVAGFSDNLPGEPELENLWWWRINYQMFTAARKAKKYPTPGEFLGLAPRMMPYLPWGWQKTSPWIFSGHWLDTVYFTRGQVNGYEEPADLRPFRIYEIYWRDESGGSGIVKARGCAFEEYEKGDWVTILKNIGTRRTSQTWKDDQSWQEEWRIAPISFYELTDEERTSEEDSHGSL